MGAKVDEHRLAQERTALPSKGYCALRGRQVHRNSAHLRARKCSLGLALICIKIPNMSLNFSGFCFPVASIESLN